MSNKPLQLIRSLRFSVSATGAHLLLCDEFDAHILQGLIYIEMAELLSHSPTWEELQTNLSSRYSPEQIHEALVKLAQIGFVRPFDLSADPLASVWWEGIGIKCAAQSIALDLLTPIGSRELEQALRSFDIGISEDADVRVVLTDDYLRPELSEINSKGQTWLLAKPCGHVLWIGPAFVPGRSPCWQCLSWWIRNHRWKQWAFHGWRPGQYPPQPSLASVPASANIAAGMIATAVAILCATGRHEGLTDSIISFDTRTLRQERHAVLPVPGCSVCGGHTADSPRKLHIFVSSITGVVSELEVSSEPVAGLFHAKGSFVHALPLHRTTEIMRAGRAFGKGVTADAAETVCIAEALERYSLTWRGDEPVIRSKRGDIDAIPPEEISQYSESQLRQRETINDVDKAMFWVPLPPDEKLETGWIACHSLLGGKDRYALAAAIYFAYPFETPEPYFVPDSNGCAAGRTREEALANALFELIERDALAIWWYNRVRRPSIRLDALQDEVTASMILSLQQAGRSVYILDVTTDIEIPALVALAPKEDGSEVIFGAAAHSSVEKAAQKALSEVAQILYWKDRVDPGPYMSRWLQTANMQADEFQWLLPNGVAEPLSSPNLSPELCIAECVRKLAKVGIEPYRVDLTRPEIGLPVVRVIAPGLRHPWARFARGRLYDVPVRLGWLPEVRDENSMNPIYCML